MKLRAFAALVAVGALLAVAPLGGAADAGTGVARYNVVLAGTSTEDGFALAGTQAAALALVASAGGTVVHDLSAQIGVLVVDSPNALFANVLRAAPLVEEVGEDFKWKAFPSYEEALATGALTPPCRPDPSSCPPGGPEPSQDSFEGLQWDMKQIRTEQAHAVQAGSAAVQVGILDSGIDGTHPDFALDEGGTNVDCANGADFVPAGPSVGIPDPCIDNQFHGTHVAGIVAAQANGIGVVGVAPNITLVPVKVCDTAGYCYSSASAAAITYAGEKKFEVINMSYFVDDDQLLSSTEFKCMDDPVQRAFRKANERAIQYARNQGVVPVAALGNSDNDLAHPPEPYENDCDVVPAETQGVIGTMSLGPSSEKAYYSNYGFGMTDVAAPGGNSRNNEGEIPGPCGNQVLSTIPHAYGCFQGTSMASPHAAGVAALIVSQFGRISTDAGEPDVVMRPQQVEDYMQSTTIDLIAEGQTETKGYDYCFGNGRIDALRAVLHATSYEAFTTEPCPEPHTG
jgi:subtilisin family serine protease